EYRQRGFAFLDETAPSQTLAYDLNASYSQTLLWSLSARLSFSYQFNRKSAAVVGDTYASALTLLQSFDSGLQANLSFTDRRNILGVKEHGVFALVSWAIPGTNHYVTATSDTIRQSN